MAETIPETMIAIGFDAPGGPEVLQPQTLPVPNPGAGQVLVKVAYAGVNRPDVVQRRGLYPPPPGASPIPGLEVAGEIVALGAGVDDDMLGQQVCALVAGGGYAEYCLAMGDHCLPVPADMPLDQAAAADQAHQAAAPVGLELAQPLGRAIQQKHLGVHGRHHIGDVRFQVNARVQQMRPLAHARQGDGVRAVSSLQQTGQNAAPAPSPVPGAMHQQIVGHQITPLLRNAACCSTL